MVPVPQLGEGPESQLQLHIHAPLDFTQNRNYDQYFFAKGHHYDSAGLQKIAIMTGKHADCWEMATGTTSLQYRVSLQSPFARGALNNNLNRWNLSPNPMCIPLHQQQCGVLPNCLRCRV